MFPCKRLKTEHGERKEEDERNEEDCEDGYDDEYEDYNSKLCDCSSESKHKPSGPYRLQTYFIQHHRFPTVLCLLITDYLKWCSCCHQPLLHNDWCRRCLQYVHFQGTQIIKQVADWQQGGFWLTLNGRHYDDDCGDTDDDKHYHQQNMRRLKTFMNEFKHQNSALARQMAAASYPSCPTLWLRPNEEAKRKAALPIPETPLIVFVPTGQAFECGPDFNLRGYMQGEQESRYIRGRGYEGIQIRINRGTSRLELVQCYYYLS